MKNEERMEQRMRLSTRAIMTELNCERIYNSVVRDLNCKGISLIINGNPQALDTEVLVDFVNPKTGNLIQVRGRIVAAKSTNTSTRVHIQFVHVSRYNQRNLENLIAGLKSRHEAHHFVSL